MQVVVEASATSQKAHEAGIFAQFRLLVKDESNRVALVLYDGALRKGKDGWWVSPPSKQIEAANGEKKYLKHWYLYPDDRDVRNSTEQWIIEEIMKQIGDPEKAIRSDNQGGTSQGNTNRAGGSRAPFAPAPAGNKPTGRVNSPFSGSSIAPGNDG
jgi:hypothetical protein